MFSLDGKSTAGMGPTPAGMQDSGIPPMWQTYVTVDDVDETVAKVTEHSGSVVMPTMLIFESGRMAVVAEPGGAVVSLWEAGSHVGAEVFNQPGALTWNELNTRDSAASREFWGEVLGWTFSEMDPGGDMDYWLIRVTGKPDNCADDDMNGGVLQMNEQWPADIPPHWMVYFWVEDTDATIETLEELGGHVSVPPFDTSVAVVGDDQGSTFSIIAPPTG